MMVKHVSRLLAVGVGVGMAAAAWSQTTGVVTPPLQQPYGSTWSEETAPNKSGPVAAPRPPTDRSSECDSACLTQLMQRYLDALVRRDFTGLPVSPNLLVAENGHPTRIGESVWKVLETLDPGRVILTDPVAGQAVMIGTLQESAHQPFIFVVRLKAENRLIAEVESMVTSDVNAAQHFRPDNLAKFDPVTMAVLPADQRMSRADLMAAATQMLQGGTLKLSADPSCVHWENGDKLVMFGCSTSEAPAPGAGLVYDNRAMRHVLVDTDRGLVVSYMLKDTSPYLNPNPPDNERTPLFYQRPMTLYAMQILKLGSGNRILAHQLFMNAQEQSLLAVFVPSAMPMMPGGQGPGAPGAGAPPAAGTSAPGGGAPPPGAGGPPPGAGGAPGPGGPGAGPQAAVSGCPPYADGGTYDSSPIAEAIDTNHDGKLSHDEWRKAGAPEDSWNRFMGYPAEKAQGYITRAQFTAEMPPNGIDSNCDHKVTLQEFLDISKKMGAGPPRP